jgi:hypothetical protein
MRLWIDRVTRMTPVDYALAIEVLAVAVWIELRLRVIPFSRLVDRLSRPSLMRGPFATETRMIPFVRVALDILPVPNTCLRRSLVMYRLLWRRGLTSRICFGVAKNGSVLDAHAWIVSNSALPVDAIPRFVQLTSPAEELPHVIHEQLWLLESREVSAARHIG